MDTPVNSSIIDAHIHIWDFASYRNTDWLADRPALKRSFLPTDWQPELSPAGVSEGIIIEADKSSYAYNIWWLEVTEYCPYLKAVVLGADLTQDSLKIWLEAFTQWPGCKGIRSRLTGPPKAWAGHPGVSRAMKMLAERNLVLELQVEPDQLEGVGVLLEHHPDCRVVLDACGRPPSNKKAQKDWESMLRLHAAHDLINIKCSRLADQCGGDEVRGRELLSFLAETFGNQRLIWGSGWPLLPDGQSYQQAVSFARRCFGDRPSADINAFFRGNARRIYRMG